ncbi:MAG: IclR family transcriptional regulator [Proteobacteria bacterium]|nr:IclR family transcriptional regulator [Pseudomonadota bacterium]
MARKIDREPPLLRAMALIERVARADGAASLQALTQAAGLPKPTVYRMLTMLEEAGLVSREPDGRRVVAGPRLARLALDVLMNEAVRTPRHAILARLGAEVGETVNLTMLDRSEVVYLDRVESAWPLRMTLQPGSRVPLHCTASGKLLLASMPAARRRRVAAALELVRYTDNTITEPRALERELATIRRHGYATDNEEFLAGVVCVAVPVTSTGGAVVASVAVHAPVARMPLERVLTLTPALRRAATALTESFATDARGDTPAEPARVRKAGPRTKAKLAQAA